MICANRVDAVRSKECDDIHAGKLASLTVQDVLAEIGHKYRKRTRCNQVIRRQLQVEARALADAAVMAA